MEERQVFSGLQNLPKILKLNSGGEALEWITYEDSAYYYAKDSVLWSMGKYDVLLRGGTNAKTGKRTVLTMDTIIAVQSDISPTKFFQYKKPVLKNHLLFERDRYICAYCGNQFKKHMLTRDHVTPRAHGGANTWDNCVTACKSCNHWKADKDIVKDNIKLLYVPYTPTHNEHLILRNRNILHDQMEFLLKGVSKNSRLLT